MEIIVKKVLVAVGLVLFKKPTPWQQGLLEGSSLVTTTLSPNNSTKKIKRNVATLSCSISYIKSFLRNLISGRDNKHLKGRGIERGKIHSHPSFER